MPRAGEDMCGKKIGRLRVVNFSHKNENGWHWLCQCDCGNTAIRRTSELKKVSSAGCRECANDVKSDVARIHGGSGRNRNPSKLYMVWCTMRRRCNSIKDKHYKWYGAKGVRICEEWNDFSKFREWAHSNGYQPGLTIDRVNSKGNYEPSNCRWITQSENSRLAYLENTFKLLRKKK